MRRMIAGFVALGLTIAACSGGPTSTTTVGPTSTTTSLAAPSTSTAPREVAPPAADTSTAPTTQATTTTTAPSTTTEAVDRTPPEITITAPRPDESVTERSYRFAGFTEPGATLTAAGRYPVDVAADGSWAVVLILNPGGNIARFVAEDAAGNQTEVNLPVRLYECADRTSAVIAAAATDTSSLAGDIDADGLTDTLTVYRAGSEWHVHAALGYDYATDVVITPPTPVAPQLRARSLIDLGFPALLVELGAAAGGRAYGFVTFSSCSLVPVVDGSGQLPVIWAGSTDAHTDLFMCEPGLITQILVEHVEYGTTIGVWEDRHRLDGLGFLPVKKTVRQVATTPESADADFIALVGSYEGCEP